MVSAQTTCLVGLDQMLGLFGRSARPSLPIQIVRCGLPVRPIQAVLPYSDHVLNLFGLFFLILHVQHVRIRCSAYSDCSDQVLGLFRLFNLFGAGVRLFKLFFPRLACSNGVLMTTPQQILQFKWGHKITIYFLKKIESF